jgi:acyl-coenzyme A synthetase/AMP-(fatty) acid ligase
MSVHGIGGTTVVMEHFDAEDYLKYAEKYKATHTQVVPTMFIRMLKLDEAVRNSYDVSSLKVAIHAAAPCPIATKHAMINWWGPIIHEYYAGTEGNGFVYCNSDMWLAHPGTVGTAISVTKRAMNSHQVNQGQCSLRVKQFSSTTMIQKRQRLHETPKVAAGQHLATLGT